MQSKWKTCPQVPNAILNPLSLVGLGLAWYSILGSFNELRHIAHFYFDFNVGKIFKLFLKNHDRIKKNSRGILQNTVILTVSAQISHDHMATAFHFLISNLGDERGIFVGLQAFVASAISTSGGDLSLMVCFWVMYFLIKCCDDLIPGKCKN